MRYCVLYSVLRDEKKQPLLVPLPPFQTSFPFPPQIIYLFCETHVQSFYLLSVVFLWMFRVFVHVLRAYSFTLPICLLGDINVLSIIGANTCRQTTNRLTIHWQNANIRWISLKLSTFDSISRSISSAILPHHQFTFGFLCYLHSCETYIPRSESDWSKIDIENVSIYKQRPINILLKLFAYKLNWIVVSESACSCVFDRICKYSFDTTIMAQIRDRQSDRFTQSNLIRLSMFSTMYRTISTRPSNWYCL